MSTNANNSKNNMITVDENNIIVHWSLKLLIRIKIHPSTGMGNTTKVKLNQHGLGNFFETRFVEIDESSSDTES